MNRKCEHCGKEFPIRGGTSDSWNIGARFCTKKCRHDANNERRKIKRQSLAIADYIYKLHRIERDTSNAKNREFAERALEEITRLWVHSEFREFDEKMDELERKAKPAS